MVKRFLRPLSMWLVFSAPVLAQDITENEALLMRIVFDDCIGFVEENRPPFSDLSTLPITQAGKHLVPLKLRETGQIRHLFSPRYVAAWGDDTQRRYCMIMTDPVAGGDMVLGVRYDGFIDRFTARAASVGISNAYPDNALSALVLSTWDVPNMPENKRLSVTLVPTGASEDESILDVGLIVVAAGVERFVAR